MKELFNKSLKEAAEALTILTKRKMNLSSSNVEIITGDILINDINEKYEEPYFGSIIKIKDEIESNVVFLISEKDGLGLYDYIQGNEPGTTTEINEDVTSGIGEINNIIGSAFVNNLANMLKTEIHPQPPKYGFDMLGALLEGIFMQEEFINKKILCAHTQIQEAGREAFRSRLLIMVQKKRLLELLKTL